MWKTCSRETIFSNASLCVSATVLQQHFHRPCVQQVDVRGRASSVSGRWRGCLHQRVLFTRFCKAFLLFFLVLWHNLKCGHVFASNRIVLSAVISWLCSIQDLMFIPDADAALYLAFIFRHDVSASCLRSSGRCYQMASRLDRMYLNEPFE